MRTTQEGFTFRHPDKSTSPTIYPDVEAAQHGAAFASDRPYGHILMPDDWRRAYKQGFRIVRARMQIGKPHSRWKEPALS